MGLSSKQYFQKLKGAPFSSECPGGSYHPVTMSDAFLDRSPLCSQRNITPFDE